MSDTEDATPRRPGWMLRAAAYVILAAGIAVPVLTAAGVIVEPWWMFAPLILAAATIVFFVGWEVGHVENYDG